MTLEHKEGTIQAARLACKNSGRGLTKKRQRILEILLNAPNPMSAYEVTDAYNLEVDAPIMAMSVYRILDYLESVRLVHRLHSANKYIACNNPCGACEHQTSLFLICTSCHSVSEVKTPGKFLQLLTQVNQESGFDTDDLQLEIKGTCKKCQSTINPTIQGTTLDEASTAK